MLETGFNQITKPEMAPPSLTTEMVRQKSYNISLLKAGEIGDFLALQAKVWNALPVYKKHHIKLRTTEDLQDHIAAGMPVIAIRENDGKLVAQGILGSLSQKNVIRNIQGYPVREDDSLTTVVQSLGVDPDRQGHGLSHIFLATAKYLAQFSGHKHLLAKVADDNLGSRASFMKNDFYAASSGKDPILKHQVTYLRCDI